jgi:hypothetical protein
MNARFDADALEAASTDSTPDGDGVLARADELVRAASTRLRDQEDQLEALHGLIECLVELGPPLAILEASHIRAWSPALAAVTGVPSSRAVGGRLLGVLPALQATGEGRWRWEEPGGVEWTISLRHGGHRLQILCWTPELGVAPAGAVRSSSAQGDGR